MRPGSVKHEASKKISSDTNEVRFKNKRVSGLRLRSMKNRITDLFKKKKAGILSVFYTAGFPRLESTVPIAVALQEAGVDMIEIGIPFSDPVADGPTIQASNKVALENGMNLKLILSQVEEIRRQKVTLPIILMGYFNPVMQYGVERFIRDAASAGIDGLIIPDLPVDEFEESYRELFQEAGLCNTFLISPTTSPDRIRRLDAATHGFIYAVSASSTTGAKSGFDDGQLQYFKSLKEMKLANPYLIGFGISNHQTFKTAASFSAGVIVGSAFIKVLERTQDLTKDITQFVNDLKG